jgi:hypothetical protein
MRKTTLPRALREGGPVAGEDCLVEGVVVAANVVWSDDSSGGKDRADLGVERVEGAEVKGSAR